MNNIPQYYDLHFKQRTVEYYLENQSTISLCFVTNLFKISRGRQTAKQWYDRSDGTISLFEQCSLPGRPSVLNQQQIDEKITKVRFYNYDYFTLHRNHRFCSSGDTHQSFSRNGSRIWRKKWH